jgi:hypothetical protein
MSVAMRSVSAILWMLGLSSTRRRRGIRDLGMPEFDEMAALKLTETRGVRRIEKGD